MASSELAEKILVALLTSENADDFNKRLDQIFKPADKREPPERIDDDIYRRGKMEFRSC